MTKKNKRFLKLLRQPREVRYSELHSILSDFGYTLERIRGSHFHYDKPGAKPIHFPVHHNKVKKCYVRQIFTTLHITPP